jgi:UDP-2,3-diacylglucosamine pyrophosphatase LpxH
MPLDLTENLIIVSDLHLASGIKLNRQEDFFSDAAFARFIDHLLRRAAEEHRTWRLLLLGDVFDFLHIPEFSPGSSNHPLAETALAKLDQIAAGHPEFFEALGRLAAAGFPLDFMPGNHDIELLFAPVQQHLTDLLTRFSPQAALSIRFYPWIYYLPGLLYAEHGQQHHDLNTFPLLLGLAQQKTYTSKNLPVGSHFDTYLYALLNRLVPQVECIKPPLAVLRQAVRAHPVAFLTAARLHLSFFNVLMRVIFYQPAHDEQLLEPYAAEIGLDHATLVTLSRLSSVSSLSILKRLLRKTLPQKKPGEGDYLQQAARNIHQILKAADLNVRYYVFGHSHTAGQFPLSPDGTAWYLNCGTWTTLPPEACPAPAHPQPLTFVEVSRETAQLWSWDDAAGESRPFP